MSKVCSVNHLKKIFSISAIMLACVIPEVSSAEVSLCIKKSLKISNQKLSGAKLLKSASGICPKGFIKIFGAASEAELSEKIKLIDGIGSGLDADLLDGLSSEAFATSASVGNLSTQLQSAESSISTLQGRVSNAESALTVLGNQANGTDSEVTQLDVRVDSAETSIGTQDGRIVTLESKTSPARVINVATTGGDFNNLATAISSLSSPSVANAYLVLVAPGTYTLTSQLVVPSGVTIRGSGKYATIITGDISNSSVTSAATVRLSHGSRLQNLKVINTASTDNFGVAVLASSITETSPELISSLDTELDAVFLQASGTGAGTNIGLYASTASLIVRDSIITALNGVNNNRGAQFFTQTAPANSNAFVINSDVITGTAPSVSTGVEISSSSATQAVQIRNSNINAAKVGVSIIVAAGESSIIDSSITAATTGISVDGNSGGALIKNVFIDSADNLSLLSGSATCLFVSQREGSAFNEACE